MPRPGECFVGQCGQPWEMQIKIQLGRLKLNMPLAELVSGQVIGCVFLRTVGKKRCEKIKTPRSSLPSLIQTARRQGVHPRQFLQTLLTVDTPTAQAALYNNSS
jgi:hypothetical protein